MVDKLRSLKSFVNQCKTYEADNRLRNSPRIGTVLQHTLSGLKGKRQDGAVLTLTHNLPSKQDQRIAG